MAGKIKHCESRVQNDVNGNVCYSMVVTGNGKNCTSNPHLLNTQECFVWHEGLCRSLVQHARVKLI